MEKGKKKEVKAKEEEKEGKEECHYKVEQNDGVCACVSSVVLPPLI